MEVSFQCPKADTKRHLQHKRFLVPKGRHENNLAMQVSFRVHRQTRKDTCNASVFLAPEGRHEKTLALKCLFASCLPLDTKKTLPSERERERERGIDRERRGRES